MSQFDGVHSDKMTGYKITTVDRARKFGIAANSLEMLREKALKKLNLTQGHIYLSDDGTKVDDEEYFASIKPQTLFVVAQDGETFEKDSVLKYEAIRDLNKDYLGTGELILKFINANRLVFDRFLHSSQTTDQELVRKIASSSREDHIEWFNDLPAHLKTKEEVMARKSQDRIRGYYYKTRDDLTKSDLYKKNKSARYILNKVIEIFKIFLTGTDYFATLFDRKCENKHPSIMVDDETDGETPRKKFKREIQSALDDFDLKDDLCVSLCTSSGEFRCHGLWTDETCAYPNHSINPYTSREDAILFQIWNLDHQIEISRTVIPSLLEQVQILANGNPVCKTHKRPAKMISVLRYFLELFTMDNLKLVHIVCHDKGSHLLESQGRLICNKCDEYKTVDKILTRVNVSIL